MENIKAINIQHLGVHLEKMGDFLYHEGPLLSLFKDKTNLNSYYFYKWTDSDDKYNRWLVFHVHAEQLRAFLFQEVSLKSLIFKNTFAFLIDIDNDLNQKQCLIASVDNIPKSYLPTEHSFYKQGKYSTFAESLKSTMDVNTSYDIFNMLNYLMVELDHIKKEQSKEMSLITQLLSQRPLDNLMP
jgi:hypothetical protein